MLPALPLKPLSSSLPSPSPLTPSFEPSPGLPASDLDLSLPVSQLLRTGTKRAHEEVEHSPGASRLAKAELGREEYARWCVALWCVYDALESTLLFHSSNPVLSPTYHPSVLSRSPPLSADISALLLTSPSTSAWQSHPAASSLLKNPPAPLKKYVARIERLAEERPELLLAHAYVRYLGDLSGGQIIRRRLAKSLSLSSSSAAADDAAPPPGLSFFSFPSLSGSAGVASPTELKEIKDWFRAGMDQGVGDDAQLKKQLVEEANEAFLLNAGLFTMLDEAWVPSQLSKEKEEEKAEEVYSPLAKLGSSPSPSPREEGKDQGGFPMTSFISFLVAVGLAHFLLVTFGFTGRRGWEKFEMVGEWVRGKLDL